MITEKDLVEAIAECQGQRNPDANTCIKLASYITILNDMRGEPPAYSFAPSPGLPDPVSLDSGTEFAEAVEGKDPSDVLRVMDELMTAVSVFHPRLYAATLRKLREWE